MNLLSHLLFAISISEVLGLNTVIVAIFSVIPDIDFMIGLTHRGLTHSLTIIGIIVLISFMGYKIFGKKKYNQVKNYHSIVIGLLAHLVLDILTFMGVQLLFPFGKFYSYNFFNSYDVESNLFVVFVSLVVLINKNLLKKKLMKYNPRTIRLVTYSLLIIFLIIPIVISLFNQTVSLNELISNPEFFDEKSVIVNGVVCSNISEYTSNAGNDYLIFDLCENNESIKIWLLERFYNNVSLNENLCIEGTFTTKYEELEITNIKWVSKN